MSAPWRPGHRIGRHSVFFRMLGIFVITTFLILVAFGGFFKLAFRPLDPAKKNQLVENAEQYASYLIRDLGVPPSLEKARALAQRLSLEIRVEGPAANWSTDESLPAIRDFQTRESHFGNRSRMGHFRRQFYLIREEGGYRYAFSFSRPPSEAFRPEALLPLVAVVLVVLLGAYMALGLVFRPLRKLMEGVREVGEGNLDFKMELHRRDEMGELASAFNRMMARVRDMIESRDQLLRDVSHEVRTPLTRIRMGLELLPDNPAKEGIAADVMEVDRMIGQILESERLKSRHGRLKKTRFELTDLVDEMVLRLGAVQPGVRVLVGDANARLEVEADRERLGTALKNLVENALKYSREQPRPIEVSLDQTGSFARVHVRDYGPGIAPEEQDLIFEPFYRIDKSRNRGTGGYGLGLSLAREIAVAHQGSLSVASGPAEGATFTLALPAVSTRSG